MRLHEQAALVTGGRQGIGRAIVDAFVSEGADVMTCGRASRPSDLPSIVGWTQTDLANQDEIEELSFLALDRFGGLDILVNNAAHVGMGLIKDVNLDEFQKNFRTNVDAPYAGTKAAMVAMSEKGGSIINVSSVNGDRAMVGMSGYGASKAALLHFTRNAAMEGARLGVRINSVTPGPIMTPATKAWFDSDPNAGTAIANANPMGRIGTPEEVANVVYFLASDESSYITGASIPVDGGKANELYVPT